MEIIETVFCSFVQILSVIKINLFVQHENGNSKFSHFQKIGFAIMRVNYVDFHYIAAPM